MDPRRRIKCQRDRRQKQETEFRSREPGVAGVQELQNRSPEFRVPKNGCHWYCYEQTIGARETDSSILQLLNSCDS